MAGSVRLDTIPDNSILIKVATPSISTYWFFKGYNNTFDAFSTPHWTKDAVSKPVETRRILYENTNSYWTICLLIKKIPWIYSQDFHGFSFHSVNFLMVGGYTNVHQRTGQYPLPRLHQFLKHETTEVLLLPPHPPLDGTTPEGDSHIKLMGMLLVSLRHRICRFWFPLKVLHTWTDRKPINVSLWVVSNKIHCSPVVDPVEEPGRPGPPLIFRPKWGPKGEKKFFLRPPPLILGSGCPAPHLIWRSRSATVSL